MTANTAKVTNSTSASGHLTSGTLPMARLSGTLPALNGSALTNLPSDVTVSTTAPSSPAAGDMWFDSSSGVNVMKVWSGAGWNTMSNQFAASGGTVTYQLVIKFIHLLHLVTFTADADGTIDVFLVGGGGCGGVDIGGGGGAGSNNIYFKSSYSRYS